jgi:hypothetical protein
MRRWNRRKAWDILRNETLILSPKDKLLTLKVIRECDESKFALFKECPSLLSAAIIIIMIIMV